jgi:hypothetical protein
MLPTWGDKVTKAWGIGPEIFTPANAEAYGRFLGRRYKDAPNLIWILGGDRVADGKEAVWRAMAKGLAEGDGGRHLMTYHPQGGRSSSAWFHRDGWLAFHMLHVRNLLLSRPFLGRVPDQSLIAGDPGQGPDHVRATRAGDRSYAMLYLPTGKPVAVDLAKLAGPKLKAWWFDPRTGKAAAIGQFEAKKPTSFDPPGTPGRDNDWVLVLDDASKGYPPPGASTGNP